MTHLCYVNHLRDMVGLAMSSAFLRVTRLYRNRLYRKPLLLYFCTGQKDIPFDRVYTSVPCHAKLSLACVLLFFLAHPTSRSTLPKFGRGQKIIIDGFLRKRPISARQSHLARTAARQRQPHVHPHCSSAS